MAIDTLRRALVFVALCLAQALVLNHIRLFGCAMPLLYVYFIIVIPRGYPRWATLVWAFFLGLTIDMFSNIPGVGTASLTFVGLLQPYLLELFLPREAAPNLKSSMATLGIAKFVTLALLLTLVHCAFFFTLEMFRFSHLMQWVLNVIGSTLLTLILIVSIETVRKP